MTLADLEVHGEKPIKTKSAKRGPDDKLEKSINKVGAPKKSLKLDANQKSILTFLPPGPKCFEN